MTLHKPNKALWWLGLLLAMAALSSLFLGPATTTRDIVFQLRLPRVAAGILVGLALATAGALYQGLLRNPLADPFILGTSSGASLGVLAAAFCHWHSPIALYSLAMLFAFLSIGAVFRISQVDGRSPVQTLVLAGVVVSTFLNALVFLGFSLFFKESFSTLFFLLGTLAQYDPVLLKISALLIALGIALACVLAPSLNVLSQGEETARQLGLHPEKIKWLLFITASALVAGAVAMSGMIGFIGLIVPHSVRLLTGPDHRRLIPASALGGALLLVILDVAARTLAAPREIPVGVLAALCGTPFFIYLLKKKKGEMF